MKIRTQIGCNVGGILKVATANPGVIRALPLFSSLTDVQFSALLPSLQQRSYAPRSLILRAGDEPDGFYFVLSGRVKVLMDNDDGRRILLAVLGPSEFFGETELINGEVRSANVETHDACQVLHIPPDDFAGTLMLNDRVVALILRSVVERLRRADQKIHELVFLDVYERVASTLLDTSLEKDGEWLVGPGCEQIAMMVGASREMVSRVLKEMIRLGMIRRQRRKLIVLDRPAVVNVARRNGRGTQEKTWNDGESTEEQRGPVQHAPLMGAPAVD
jgi:CRP/FNR family transcriptional regulator, cyclic AMP receptor protein